MSVFSLVACRDAPKGLDAASTVHGKTLLSFIFVGTHELHLDAAARVTHQTSLNQTPIDKRGIETIFSHFRGKPARWSISFYKEPLHAILLALQRNV